MKPWLTIASLLLFSFAAAALLVCVKEKKEVRLNRGVLINHPVALHFFGDLRTHTPPQVVAVITTHHGRGGQQ